MSNFVIKYLLDTDICIFIINEKPTQVIEKLQQFGFSEIGISAITLSELEYGISKSKKPEQNKQALLKFISPLEVLSYNNIAAIAYGEIRASLESAGTVIGPLDMLIAAHAYSLGCTLVTNNTKEFNRVPNLLVENWAKSS